MRQSVSAMATSHHWAILKEMKAPGDFPEVLWIYADAMPTNEPLANVPEATVANYYRDGLGCDTP